jgi:molybdate transport system substrate-binding protein
MPHSRRSALVLALVLGAGLGSGRGMMARQGVDCRAFAPVAASPAAGAATPMPAPAASFPEEGGDLTVFAAASLTDAFQAVADDLQQANPEVEITFNFAGSQTLVTQLTGGARADLFSSANLVLMAAAEDAGLIAGEPLIFARNELVIAVPATNPAGIEQPEDLADPGVKLVLAQPEVPAGQYAREAICNLGGETLAGSIAANVVSEEEDVRGVLAKVEFGEADAGIVYRGDVLAAGDAVLAIDLPEGAGPEALYPIAAVTGGDLALAEAFIAWLLGPEGQATLADYGFEPAGA